MVLEDDVASSEHVKDRAELQMLFDEGTKQLTPATRSKGNSIGDTGPDCVSITFPHRKLDTADGPSTVLRSLGGARQLYLAKRIN